MHALLLDGLMVAAGRAAPAGLGHLAQLGAGEPGRPRGHLPLRWRRKDQPLVTRGPCTVGQPILPAGFEEPWSGPVLPCTAVSDRLDRRRVASMGI